MAQSKIALDKVKNALVSLRAWWMKTPDRFATGIKPCICRNLTLDINEQGNAICIGECSPPKSEQSNK